MSVFHSWSWKHTQYAWNIEAHWIGSKLSGFLFLEDGVIFIYFKDLRSANESETFSQLVMTNILIPALQIVSDVPFFCKNTSVFLSAALHFTNFFFQLSVEHFPKCKYKIFKFMHYFSLPWCFFPWYFSKHPFKESKPQQNYIQQTKIWSMVV